MTLSYAFIHVFSIGTTELTTGPAVVSVIRAGITVGVTDGCAINVEVLRAEDTEALVGSTRAVDVEVLGAKDTEVPVASTRTVDDFPGPSPRPLINNEPCWAAKLDMIADMSASLMVKDVLSGLYGCMDGDRVAAVILSAARSKLSYQVSMASVLAFDELLAVDVIDVIDLEFVVIVSADDEGFVIDVIDVIDLGLMVIVPANDGVPVFDHVPVLGLESVLGLALVVGFAFVVCLASVGCSSRSVGEPSGEGSEGSEGSGGG